MQDYNYVFAGCFEVTVMVGCCRYPPENQTEQLWEDNRDSVINFIKQAHLGKRDVPVAKKLSCTVHVRRVNYRMVIGKFVVPVLTSLYFLGVKGIVTNENGDAIANVKVMVADREVHPMLTSSTGEFFRLLLPGDHVLIVGIHQPQSHWLGQQWRCIFHVLCRLQFEHEDYATVEHEVSIKASLQQSSSE